MEGARTLTEWIVLCVLAERPAHGWAVARELRPGSELGEVWTVSRPLVYRAIARLEAERLVRARRREHVPTGPPRVVLAATTAGRRTAQRWLATPVDHVRDLRTALLAKLILHRRAALDAGALLQAQRDLLTPIVAVLEERAAADPRDVVAAWRAHSARAASAFVEDLLRREALG